jgi:hypothetical protein
LTCEPGAGVPPLGQAEEPLANALGMQRAITIAPTIIALELFIFILLSKNRIIATCHRESRSRSRQASFIPF